MGNNLQKRNRRQEDRACNKIFKAVSSPLRNNLRTSKRSQSTDTRPNPEAIRVKFAETSAQTAKPMSDMGPTGKKKKKTVTRVGTVKTDERFSDYIKRAKLKIRAMTNLGDIRSAEATEAGTGTHTPVPVHEDSGRDKFGEYIKKAKMKLRFTSSIGHGNPNRE
ncbi:PREDICTED: uncharacterized protein LOC104817543 [Tarenaya hassleriana]|uniref:uncharacterized protein LOC104817543 n=1 Tax=Tarenaya hassleriana TaxID=28532 RepID=UPI00053C7D6D|nr:PREDICTED: uncharacterized protein LOC104817543 [Tarenaya hassleriana]